ncbi:glycosyltransferase [Methylocapsa sp. D3K7]|uniref:glycosyltransferase n=1 Tax=Methylocapsa sp. D3K7 TaxID=3041435 RepID=UPI00244EC4C1|nr:glycosyltransferase [Methylocapsa sp. D3K7]WGJ14340.1 glycosyltransferase [Methylocapsa sp. D3K7]
MIRQFFDRLLKIYKAKPKFFDQKYYLLTYPDVAKSGINPFFHFKEYGWREGRNPSRIFNTLYYKDKNLGKEELSFNPLDHYKKYNKTMKLKITPDSEEEYLRIQRSVIKIYFNEFYYRKRYTDINNIDALDHYLRIGWRQGYDPTPSFSTTEYLNAHPDVLILDVSPFYHYISTSNPKLSVPDLAELAISVPAAAGGSINGPSSDLDIKEVMKTLSSEFDADFYLKEFQDVRTAKIDPVKHYVEYGWREGRNPTALFWTSYYLSKYGDVRASNLNPFFHYIKYGRREGRRPNPVGAVLWERPKAPSKKDWHLAFSAKDVPDAEVTIIMPVYKGFSDTLASIYSVLTNPQETSFNLLVINDCGPEDELNETLRDLAAEGWFGYAENQTNLGFVRTVNEALAYRPDLDVILLNSDTLVFGNWIDRLLAHARRDESVATITPFSNNATICSYPEFNRNNLISLEVPPAVLDEYTSVCNEGRSNVVPTGVGFCFYMRRSIINILGTLDDSAFGKGYGEENDYCLRALKAGFKNVFAHDVFVYHTGKISFASLASNTYESGQTALLNKHPDYGLRVQRYIEANPSHEARLRLDLYRLARSIGPGAAIFITHSWTGGVFTHAHSLAQRLARENVKVVFLRVGGRTEGKLNVNISVQNPVDVYTPSLGPMLITKYQDLILDFIGWLRPKILHVHSFAGLDWQGVLAMMSILKDAPCPYHCTVHDYSSICHRNDCVTTEGIYCGQPATSVCRACIRADRGCSDFVDPDERRSVYGAFLEAAKQVFVPSMDTAKRLKRVFPLVEPIVKPHAESHPGSAWLPALEEFPSPLRIAVIGGIGTHKGSGVLHGLALDARRRSLPIEFTIVGFSNKIEPLKKAGVKETGKYASDDEAIRQLHDLRPHLAFFPSIWPETYCYTLSIALACGIPAVVFDIGAQAERLRALAAGHILELALIDQLSALNDALLQLPLAELWQNRRYPDFASYDSVLEDYYGLASV